MSSVKRGVVLLVAAIVGCAILLVVWPPKSAQAANNPPTLQFNCSYLKRAAIDPILDPPPGHAHVHELYGNTSVSADSTYKSLVANKGTTCNIAAGTASYWHPAFKEGGKVRTPIMITNYYRDMGERSPNMRPIPKGLQNLASVSNGKVSYRCYKGPTVDKPPYGCTKLLKIKFSFPNCWNPKAGKGPNSVIYSPRKCPASHPYEFPEHTMVAKYPRPADGRWDAPLKVSAGGGEWRRAVDFAHADRFNADQDPEFDNKWMGPCVLDVPPTQDEPEFCENARD